MATLRLDYPVIVFHLLDVEVSDEQADEVMNMSLQDQAKFIEEQNEDRATGHMLPSLQMIEAALDMDYATIKRLPE